jgi:peroxiredoxin
MTLVEPNAIDELRARNAVRRLVGAQVPPITLFSANNGDGDVDMRWLSSGRGAVIYLYPGATPGTAGLRSAAADAAQARDFEAHSLALQRMGWRLAGISSQEPGEQLRHIFANAIEHIVLADPQLQLARELGLPTYSAGDRRRRYPRLALIAEQGQIIQAFCLFHAPARSARLVTAWLHDRTEHRSPLGCW